MRPFSCNHCGQMLFFQNSVCLRCGSRLGYTPEHRLLAAVRPVDTATFGANDGIRSSAGDLVEFVDGPPGWFRPCINGDVARCNWLLGADDPAGLCRSCRLTTLRPSDAEIAVSDAFAAAEAAKRHLLHQLFELGLPVIDRAIDADRGLAFELLSSRNREVTTGHAGGVITLDLSESDDAHREFVREQLGEPYRTVLGHLRHEIGHYYWPLLVEDAGRIDEFRDLFGDEQISYDDALSAHYSGGHADDEAWVHTHVSRYATMHPWEDWAETFAHYLHIRGGLETATAFGIMIGDPVRSAAHRSYRVDRDISVGETVESWLALTLALNAMSRSIGQGDLYPFVLSQRVLDKLDFVHQVVCATTH